MTLSDLERSFQLHGLYVEKWDISPTELITTIAWTATSTASFEWKYVSRSIWSRKLFTQQLTSGNISEAVQDRQLQ